ncbi:MAG TPA: MOSC domain-containing protein [Solirubrobacteraceae bacterium]
MSSLRECLAHVLGAEADDLPREEQALREWLAQRGLGLVAVADPAGFSWPGPFLARGEREWAVLFGVPPGPLLGTPDGVVQVAYVIAGHEVRPAATVAAATAGIVAAIVLAPAAEAPLRSVERAQAIAGRGLQGDRYADGAGTFSPGGGRGHDLTLVAAEVLEDAGLEPVEARRNLIVRGVDLDALRGRRFRVGTVECLGQRRCEPCAHLERLTRPGVLRALAHRGGLRADILRGGELRVGDRVEALE